MYFIALLIMMAKRKSKTFVTLLSNGVRKGHLTQWSVSRQIDLPIHRFGNLVVTKNNFFWVESSNLSLMEDNTPSIFWSYALNKISVFKNSTQTSREIAHSIRKPYFFFKKQGISNQLFTKFSIPQFFQISWRSCHFTKIFCDLEAKAKE